MTSSQGHSIVPKFIQCVLYYELYVGVGNMDLGARFSAKRLSTYSTRVPVLYSSATQYLYLYMYSCT
jgi:hypothetical protein